MQADEAHSAPARPNQVATMAALETAMAHATASHEPKAQPKRLSYAEARADLDARARAGRTVQGRDNKGRFLRSVKVSTAGSSNVIPFRRPVPKASEVVEPTAEHIHSVLITCFLTGLSDSAKLAFHARLQKRYDRAAGNAERQRMVIAAAEVVCAPLKTGIA